MLRTDVDYGVVKTLKLLHARTLERPIAILRRSRERDVIRHFPLQFSESRGYVAVLSADNIPVDAVGIDVLANCGAQLMNSPLYISRRESR